MQGGAGGQGQALWLLQGQPRALQETMERVNGPTVPLPLGTRLGLFLSASFTRAQQSSSPCCIPWFVLATAEDAAGAGLVQETQILLSAASLGHLAAEQFLGKFCTGQAPPVLEGSSVGSNGHHEPTLPQ